MVVVAGQRGGAADGKPLQDMGFNDLQFVAGLGIIDT